MTEIDVLGITTRRQIRWDSGFCIMGFGDVALPQMEITLRGCALARSSGRIIALPPKIPGTHPNDLGAIQWNASGGFALRVKDALLAAYQKMGGEMPPSKDNAAKKQSRIFIPLSELDLGGTEHLPYHERIRLALEDESRCRGVECFTEIWERPDPLDAPARVPKDRPDDMPADALEQANKAAAHARRHAVARAEADEDDVSGLHRTLRVCAVEETMEKAGL